MTKIITIAIIAILGIPVALFIGKTSIKDWHIEVERPITALLFYATLLSALIEENKVLEP